MSGMNTAKLQYPITVDGKVVSELEFRRPKAKTMVAVARHLPALQSLGRIAEGQGEDAVADAVDEHVMAAMIGIVGALSGIGEEAAGELDYADLLAAAPKAMEALGNSQAGDGVKTTGEA